jgi:hypothetical protein
MSKQGSFEELPYFVIYSLYYGAYSIICEHIKHFTVFAFSPPPPP